MAETLYPTKSSQVEFKIINENIRNSINEMFRRVMDNEHHFILDRKEPPNPKKGVLQDCEFGMILIASRNWLKSHGEIKGPISNEDDVKKIIIELVERTLKRILDRTNLNVGGDEKEDIVFFSGEPYTYYRVENVDDAYSANLDAAMLIISFLSLALQSYDNFLKGIKWDLKIEDVKLPDWVNKNLRDVALFVCLQGLEYAARCRVYQKNEFKGFTCDPTSKFKEESDTCRLDDYDRLFFSWTACETIKEAISWLGYFERIRNENSELTGRLIDKINELEQSMNDASLWVYKTFLRHFEDLKFDPEGKLKKVNSLKDTVSIAEIVDIIEPKGKRPLEDDESPFVKGPLTDHIQHVYHLSQYAAIRSLSKATVLKTEITKISNQLDRLVREDIINSGLDAARQRELYKTLTRRYDLGESCDAPYQDDAYYPLVVRSISSLLSRTISVLDKEEERTEVLQLINSSKVMLDFHVKNMLTRRPDDEGLEVGDEKLWSYAKGNENEKGSGKEYVLYATQRTIFALLSFGDFLESVEKVVKSEKSSEFAITNLTNILSQKFAETLIGPTVETFFVDYFKSLKEMQDIDILDKKSTIPLPEPEWAKNIVIEWLTKFTGDFENSKIESFIKQQAESLKTLWEYKLPKNIKKDKKEKVSEFLKNMKISVDEIFENQLIGKQLKEINQSKKWEIEKIVNLLFKYMFFLFIESDYKSIKDLKSPTIDLWGNIRSAIDYIDSINRNT